MADFKTHITTSTVIGIGYGIAGGVLFGVPPAHCIVAGGLCSVAGMLPDLDSDSGIPLREMLSFVSVLIPMMMIRRFELLGVNPELMVLIAGLMYVGVRFGLGTVFRRFTVHRGMWHSIPAALIAGMITFLVSLSPELGIRLFKSWAVVLGFLSHLFLDEVYSIDLRGRRVKQSLGTAMKWYGNNRMTNFIAWANLLLLTAIVCGDKTLMEQLEKRGIAVPRTATFDYLHNQTSQAAGRILK